MNRKVIKKYKSVFEYWLEGGSFWARKEGTTKWEHITDSAPTLENWIYVEDDKYVEYRKAQKDGALILMRTSITKEPHWVHCLLYTSPSPRDS